MPHIVLIGAGSIVFARRLIVDILAREELQGSTLCLVDLDQDKLDLIAGFARRLIEQHGLPAQVEATLERRDVLAGADVVITCIATTSGEQWQADIEIPRRYGVDQQIGDTIGPGGVFRALRTVPVMLDICRDIAELCPQAWLLNYTNPMAICTWAMLSSTPVKAVGLCHSVQGTAHQLCGYMGIPREELDYWCAGINHMSWYLRLTRAGEDVYPQLRVCLDDPDIVAKDPVRFEVFRHFDYFVTESSPHMSEYVPYFRKRPELIEQFGLHSREMDLSRRREREETHHSRLREDIESEETVPLTASDEYAAGIIRALATGLPFQFNASVLNRGIITNLPPECAVEVPCVADRTGIHPCHVGRLPPQLAALDRSNVALQELTVQAILSRDTRAAFHAVALDPLTAGQLTLAEAREMFDELFAAHQEALPGFEPLA